MTRLIFATNNTHKIEEIQAAIGHLVEVISLKSAGINIEIPEPHDTLEQNAAEKSTTIAELTGLDCFSEDTGLEVAALDGQPGVRSARYAGETADSEKNIDKLLAALEGHPDRSARFRTVISLIWRKDHFLFEGVCPGEIVMQREGSLGFGYDAVFMPSGSNRTFAQMTIAEKNRYSHRQKAADKLVLFLQEHM